MLDGKPTIVLSYSVRYAEAVAKPVAAFLQPLGFRTVLIGEEPLPPGVESNPNSKVEWFFRHADMAVYLATPDDHLKSGETHTRPNIIDEHRLGQQMPHLQHRLLVFKAAQVTLPSNINPVYEALPLDDPQKVVEVIVTQAQAWGVLPASSATKPISGPASSNEDAESLTIGITDATADAQAKASLAAAAHAISSRSPREELGRAQLALIGLIAESGGSDPVGVHLANRLFSERHSLRLRASERLALIRTYFLSQDAANVPGAFWMAQLSRRELLGLLLSLAHEDPDSTVRANALRVLGRSHAPSLKQLTPLLEAFLTSTESQHRSIAMAVIRSRPTPQLRPLVDTPELLEWDRRATSQTLALIDLPRQPSSVLERYAEDAYVRCKEVEEGLLAVPSRIRRASVMSAIESSVDDVRVLGLALAAKKNILTEALSQTVVGRDRSPRVRAAALRQMLEARLSVRGSMLLQALDKRDDDLASPAGYDEKKALEIAVARQLPDEEVRAGVRWASALGPSFYEALGLRDTAWANRHVRRDLQDDFARLKTEGRAEMLASVMNEATTSLPESARNSLVARVDKMWSRWVDPDPGVGDYLSERFGLAALRVLASLDRPSDIRFARRFAPVADAALRPALLTLFERYGTAHDAGTVLDLAGDLYDSGERHRAAETAFRLAYKKDKLAVLASLQDNHSESAWAVQQLADLDRGPAEAWKLLWSDRPTVRAAAAQVVWDAVDPRLADELLSYYMRRRHYYNVVVHVDRRLYAPSGVKDALPED